MRIIIFCTIVFLISCCSYAQTRWNLQQCIDYAIVNNISVKCDEIKAQTAFFDLQQSRLSQYPVASFGSSLGLTNGRSIDRTTNQFTNQTILYNTFGLQVGVDIYNFGAKKATILSNLFYYEAIIAQTEKLKNDLYLNILGNYLQILFDKEQINISRVQTEQTTAQLSATRKLVKAGSLPELNALQMEAQLAKDSADLITVTGSWQNSLMQLKTLLYLDTATDFDIIYVKTNDINILPLADLNPESVYAQAVAVLPQEKADSLMIKSAKQSAISAKAIMYPSVNISGNLQTNYSNAKNNAKLVGTSLSGYTPIGIVEGSGAKVLAPNLVPYYNFYSTPYRSQFINNFGNGISLNISVPIFNGGTARKGWQKAILNIKNYELQQQENRLNLRQAIYKAWVDASISLQMFSSSHKTIEAARKAYTFAVKRYNLGLLSSVDLLTTQSKLSEANLKGAIAEYDYIYKIKILEFYKGSK